MAARLLPALALAVALVGCAPKATPTAPTVVKELPNMMVSPPAMMNTVT